MKRDSFLVTASLALATSVLLAGSASEAAGPHEAGAVGGPIAPLASRHVVQDPIVPHGFFTLPSPHQGVIRDSIVPHGLFALPSAHGGRPHARRGPRRSIVTGAFAPPVIIATPPVGAYEPEDYDTPGYYDAPDNSPAAYSPPVVYTQPVTSPVPVAPPPPPTPNVIQYETGRYELRGDGMTTPYTWVWIPNPPPPPPPAAPPGPRFADDPPARPGQLYRWTDEQGVVHLTDRLDSVPRQYRAQAKQNPPS